MGNKLTTALRYWHTLRHLQPSQIIWRLRYRLRPVRPSNSPGRPVPAFNPDTIDRLAAFLQHWADVAPPDSEETDGFLSGRFTFLNKTIQSRTPPWRDLDVPLLWAYHLHYFDYARDLALRHPGPEDEVARQLRVWVDDWVTENPPGAPVAWDPYPISIRLLNWTFLAARYGWNDDAFRTSMDVQLGALANRLEYDICGNHLMKNAAALTVAATLLNSPHRNLGLTLLKREVAAQMLPDGGHVERSTMYHGQVLLDLIMAAAALESVPPWLNTAIDRGLVFLRSTMHPDGRLAQFNDGGAEEGMAPRTIAALGDYVCPDGDKSVRVACGDSGIYRLTNGKETMIVKAGRALADFQPGHAHSDLLSFEYSQNGQRIFVNAGTHGYAESPYRNYCRSTLAHNTVCINRRDQQEHWSTFRVARRVHGHLIALNESGKALRAAYTTLDQVRHERAVEYDAAGFWLVTDHVSGRGPRHLESRLHCHPDVAVEEGPTTSEHPVYRLTVAGTSLLLVVLGGNEVCWVETDTVSGEGLYFPRFGQALPAPCLRVIAESESAHTLGAALAPLSEGTDTTALLEAISQSWNAHRQSP